MKKNVLLSMLIGWIVVVSLIVIGVALRLQNLGTRPVVPTVPESEPKAEGIVPAITPGAAACRQYGMPRVPTASPTPTLTPTTTPRTPTNTPPPRTPTATATPAAVVIQGRYFQDKDIAYNGRGGFEAPVPVCFRDDLVKKGCAEKDANGVRLLYTLPFRMDVQMTGGTNYPIQSRDLGNNPNEVDVCSTLSYEEKAPKYCGVKGGTRSGDRVYPNTHCSKFGGFSLTIPAGAFVQNVEGKLYYRVRIEANPRSGLPVANPFDTKEWVISEAYWMNPAVLNPPPSPSPGYQNTSTGVRCDRNLSGGTQCNVCLANRQPVTPARVCNLDGSGYVRDEYCEPINSAQSGGDRGYRFDKWLVVLVPVDGSMNNQTLWIGARPR